jgi:hypothetical protein
MIELPPVVIDTRGIFETGKHYRERMAALHRKELREEVIASKTLPVMKRLLDEADHPVTIMELREAAAKQFVEEGINPDDADMGTRRAFGTGVHNGDIKFRTDFTAIEINVPEKVKGK